MPHFVNNVCLHWLLEATLSGELTWTKDDNDWYLCEIAGRTLCFRVQSIETIDPVRPEPFLIDLHMPGLSTGFGAGSEGWYFLQDIIHDIEGTLPKDDTLEWLGANLPPIDPDIGATIPSHQRAHVRLLNLLLRVQGWEDTGEHGYYETHLGDKQLLLRFRYFEALNEVSAKPRMVEIHFPGLIAGYFIGTYGWAMGWAVMSETRDEIIVPGEFAQEFLIRTLPRAQQVTPPLAADYKYPRNYVRDVKLLERLLYATIAGQIIWTEVENLWHTCEVAGETIHLRSHWIASMNQIGADPYLIDLELPGYRARFTPGTLGWTLAVHLRYEMNRDDPYRWNFAQVEQFLEEHLPPIQYGNWEVDEAD